MKQKILPEIDICYEEERMAVTTQKTEAKSI